MDGYLPCSPPGSDDAFLRCISRLHIVDSYLPIILAWLAYCGQLPDLKTKFSCPRDGSDENDDRCLSEKCLWWV